MAKAKRIHRVGRGLPAGILEAQPAAPGLKGGWWPPKGHSHGGHGLSVAARSGLPGPATAPQAVLGTHGQLAEGRETNWVNGLGGCV